MEEKMIVACFYCRRKFRLSKNKAKAKLKDKFNIKKVFCSLECYEKYWRKKC